MKTTTQLLVALFLLCVFVSGGMVAFNLVDLGFHNDHYSASWVKVVMYLSTGILNSLAAISISRYGK